MYKVSPKYEQYNKAEERPNFQQKNQHFSSCDCFKEFYKQQNELRKY